MSACNGNNEKKGCAFVWQRNKGISINFENSEYHKLGSVDLPGAASASLLCCHRRRHRRRRRRHRHRRRRHHRVGEQP